MAEGDVADSDESQPERYVAQSVRGVTPQPNAFSGSGSIWELTLSSAVFAATLIALLAPPVAFAAAGVWGGVHYATGLWTLAHAVESWRVDAMLSSLSTVEAAGKMALAGGSFFALVLSLIVLFGGVVGSHRQRLYLVPGVLLCAASGALFALATHLSFPTIAARVRLAPWVQYPSLAYALLDALVLAALLLDRRPRRHRRGAQRSTRRRRAHARMLAPNETAGPSVVTEDGAARVAALAQPVGVEATGGVVSLAPVDATKRVGAEGMHEDVPPAALPDDMTTADLAGDVSLSALVDETATPAQVDGADVADAPVSARAERVEALVAAVRSDNIPTESAEPIPSAIAG